MHFDLVCWGSEWTWKLYGLGLSSETKITLVVLNSKVLLRAQMTATFTLRCIPMAPAGSRASGIDSRCCGLAAGSPMERCRAGWALR